MPSPLEGGDDFDDIDDLNDADMQEPDADLDGAEPDADLDAQPEADGEVDAQLEVDGQPSADAASEPDAETVTDAAAPADSGAPDAGQAAGDAGRADAALTDAGIPDAGGRDAGADAGAADAGVADAGTTPQPGVRILLDLPTSATALSNYAVRVLIDTQTPIRQGLLASNCSDLRVFGSTGCAQARPFFLPAYACNSTSSEVWIRVPQLSAGRREVLAVTFDGAGSESSNGSRVFSFFDDFNGSALDTSRWIPRGSGTITVSGGILSSRGVQMLESAANVVTAGQSILGARLAALGLYNTDFEFGAGAVSDSVALNVWAFGRTWDGVTFLSYDATTYVFDGPAGSACDLLANHQINPDLGANWVDHPPDAASFLTAEFSYTNGSRSTTATLRTSRGASFSYTSPSGCTLPSTLPALFSFDHLDDSSSPTQRVDYVYVRPSASVEPTVTVQTSSTSACGTQ